MIILPFQIDAEQYSVLMALDDDGLARIKRYDPAELTVTSLGSPWTSLRLKDVLVTYCNAQDLDHVQRLIALGTPRKALRYLSRGWEFRPDLGDSDDPPISLKPKPY